MVADVTKEEGDNDAVVMVPGVVVMSVLVVA